MKMLKYISTLAVVILCAYTLYAASPTQINHAKNLMAEAKRSGTSDDRLKAIHQELQRMDRTYFKSQIAEVKGMIEGRASAAGAGAPPPKPPKPTRTRTLKYDMASLLTDARLTDEEKARAEAIRDDATQAHRFTNLLETYNEEAEDAQNPLTLTKDLLSAFPPKQFDFTPEMMRGSLPDSDKQEFDAFAQPEQDRCYQAFQAEYTASNDETKAANAFKAKVEEIKAEKAAGQQGPKPPKPPKEAPPVPGAAGKQQYLEAINTAFDRLDNGEDAETVRKDLAKMIPAQYATTKVQPGLGQPLVDVDLNQPDFGNKNVEPGAAIFGIQKEIQKMQ